MIAELETRLGYHFRQPKLLDEALTHRSTAEKHMDRLEFLGDAVLGLVIAEHLFTSRPEADQGAMSRLRATLVCRQSLEVIAGRWSLAEVLRVGGGERQPDGGVKSSSILADSVEAVIGAVFLDGGWPAARSLVLDAWQALLGQHQDLDARDAKSRLQEFTQARGWGLPEYRVSEVSGEGESRFAAACLVKGEQLGQGTGAKKKDAESMAAAEAWQRLQAGEES
ncbi:MAG: ribonuclease III [Mariprofundaceae bacterium]